jgi:hypothetical protein
MASAGIFDGALQLVRPARVLLRLFCATLSDLWRASAATDSMTMPASDAEDLDTTAEVHAADDWRYA